MRRELNLVRPIFYGSVAPYFGDQYFWCAPLLEKAEEYFRHLAASRTAACSPERRRGWRKFGAFSKLVVATQTIKLFHFLLRCKATKSDRIDSPPNGLAFDIR